MYALILASPMLFLSTLSLRRATNSTNANLRRHRDFYPRSPCGERPGSVSGIRLSTAISIHALLAESDALGLLGWLRVLISIHALLAESDSKSAQNSGALLRI